MTSLKVTYITKSFLSDSHLSHIEWFWNNRMVIGEPLNGWRLNALIWFVAHFRDNFRIGHFRIRIFYFLLILMISWNLPVLISTKIWRKITRGESLLFSFIFLGKFKIFKRESVFENIIGKFSYLHCSSFANNDLQKWILLFSIFDTQSR